MTIGNGVVIPTVNFALPPIEIFQETMLEIFWLYREMIEEVLKRAIELHMPALMVDFEALPEMAVQLAWALGITRLPMETLAECG